MNRRSLLRIIVPGYPAFNVYSWIARITTALGPVSIATVANKLEDWDAEVIDENNYGRFGPRDAQGRPDYEALQRTSPADVVGFYGGLTSTIPRLYEIAAFFKQRGVVTIAGGQHFLADNVREGLEHGLDYLVLGEGELTIGELLRAIRSRSDPGTVAGIAFLREGQIVRTPPRESVTDFDRVPRPDFSLVRHARIKLYPVGWVRGCGMNCEFCTVKGKVRCPAPEYALDQITMLVERHDARHFFLVDDLFGQHRKETLRFCGMLSDYQRTVRVRLNLTVQIRLDKAADTELLLAMRGAGINTVCIGFESPIPEELEAMNKRVRPDEMLAMTRLYRKAGFLVHGMFIFGYPMPEGVSWSMPVEERIRRFRQFIGAAKIDTVQILLAGPLPGTELTARLARQNRIFPRDQIGWEYYDGNFPLFVPDPPLTPEQMQAASRKIMGRFYRFRYMFAVGLHILVFPSILFSLHNLRAGWRRWYRTWRNNLLRFSGWIILRRWTSEFEKGAFTRKLNEAKRRLEQAGEGKGGTVQGESSSSS
ncbi:MAG: B12-binding domain-containing radical SAM protein [Lentisphaerae bacterium]|nr:B12-binding domain-containing radical SAM protein [Lentisphaerota bacterium]